MGYAENEWNITVCKYFVYSNIVTKSIARNCAIYCLKDMFICFRVRFPILLAGGIIPRGLEKNNGRQQIGRRATVMNCGCWFVW